MRTNEYVINETGFAADSGLEKFVNISCRRYNLTPSAVVVVASCRALHLHGGVPFERSKVANLDALQAGVANLDIHVKIVKNFGLTPVVAINKFSADSEEELSWLQTHCDEIGVPSAISEVYEKESPAAPISHKKSSRWQRIIHCRS